MSYPSPIQKYNYERSTYRWIMARHSDTFASCGISTKILESASRARQAMYHSGWHGATVLIRVDSMGKHERTPMFENIIRRGLCNGTKFDVKLLTGAEQSSLGIAFDTSIGKYILLQYCGFPTTDSAEKAQSFVSKPIVSQQRILQESESTSNDYSIAASHISLPYVNHPILMQETTHKSSRRRRSLVRTKIKLRVEVGHRRSDCAQDPAAVSPSQSNFNQQHVKTDTPIYALHDHLSHILKDELNENQKFSISRVSKTSRKVQVIIEFVSDICSSPCASPTVSLDSSDCNHDNSKISSRVFKSCLDNLSSCSLPEQKRPRISTTVTDSLKTTHQKKLESFGAIFHNGNEAFMKPSGVSEPEPWCTEDASLFFDTLDLDNFGLGLF